MSLKLPRAVGEIRMREQVAPDHDVAALLGGARVRRDAGDAMADVGGVGRLAHLAVADDVDAGRDLLRDDLVDRLGDCGLERAGVDRVALLACARMRSISGFGRGRLPVWVVRMRSWLVFMRAPGRVIVDGSAHRRVGKGARGIFSTRYKS